MPRRTLLIALIATGVLALTASAVSGVVYTARTSPAQNCDAVCEDWHMYGWPTDWRSDWLGWLIADMEDGHSMWNYGSDGVSEGRFLRNTALWFAGLTPLIVGGLWVASRVYSLRRPPRSQAKA